MSTISSHETSYGAASYGGYADLIAAQRIVSSGLRALELDGEPDEDSGLPWSDVASERHSAALALVRRYTREVSLAVARSQAVRSISKSQNSRISL